MTLNPVLALSVLLAKISYSANLETCEAATCTQNGVQWPGITDETSSQPPCVGSTERPAGGECLNGCWSPEPSCSQSRTPPQCPEDFSETDDFCFKFTSHAPFGLSCPYSEVPFVSYIDSIVDLIPGPIWMPIRRDLSNGYGLLEWIEPSSFYKVIFEDSYFYQGGIKNKDCVIYHLNKSAEVVSCCEEHVGVCVYKKLIKQGNNTLCSTDEYCRRSNYASRNECFCYVDKLEEGSFAAEFIEPYQNSLYSLLIDNNASCTIGLVKNTTFSWSGTSQEISYTFWSPDAVSDDTHTYGAVSPLGWILTEKPESCYLVQKEVPLPEVSFTLWLDDSGQIYVNVSDLNAVTAFGEVRQVFCFTDAEYLPQVLTLNGTSNNLEVPYVGTGSYWCEFFNENLTVVRSNTITIEPKNNLEFVVIFQVSYELNLNPLSRPGIEYLKRLLSHLGLEDLNYTARFWKIVDLNEDQHLTWINVHVSSSIFFNRSLVNTYRQWLALAITRALRTSGNQNSTLLQIYNTAMCMTEVVREESGVQVTWPAVPVGAEVPPEEFCFTVCGKLIRRACRGDFFHGARWDDWEKCKVLPKSSVTDLLLPMYYGQLTISCPFPLLESSLSKLQALDVYLLKEILVAAMVNGTRITDISCFVDIISSILKIKKSVLAESQGVTRATDALLNLINETISKYDEIIDIVKDNFVLIQNYSKNISGIIIQQSLTNKTVERLSGNWSYEAIIQQKDVVSAVWLSPELRTSLGGSTKIAFTVYFSDALFGESVSTSNEVSSVFGVMIEGISPKNTLQGPINIYERISSNDSLPRSCSFWHYDVKGEAGFWFAGGDFQNANQNVCQYPFVSNFAFVVSKDGLVESAVTKEFIQLLDSTSANLNLVRSLMTISKQYEEFVSMDVFLFGKVLEAVNNNSTDLTALAKSIDNIHRTDRLVLSESQNEKQATDKILCYVDNIIRKNENASEVLHQHENFVLVISDIRRNNTGGVAVLRKNETFEVEIMRGEASSTTIARYENVDSAVIFSRELRNQLIEDSKVVVTIFFNDKLFNTNLANHKSLGTIYGVLLPRIGNYQGPVSIFHNLSAAETDETRCSHWKFRNSSEESSYWRNNRSAKNTSSLLQCDFYHTTHFALLIVDRRIEGVDEETLEWITYVTTAVSSLGLFGIVFTAVLFQAWRTDVGNQILLNFTIAIMLQTSAFYVNALLNDPSTFRCILFGAILHYSVIAEFSWMLIVGALQFKRFVRVFASSSRYLLLKASFFGWAVPLLPVTLCLAVDTSNYTKGRTGFCYPTGLSLYLGIWFPLCVVITVNFYILVHIMYSVIQRRAEAASSAKGECKCKYQSRLFVLLFFMLGLTWIFGFLAEFQFSFIFAYLFSLTGTLQGFVLFIYFIVLNTNTRDLYKKAIRNSWSWRG